MCTGLHLVSGMTVGGRYEPGVHLPRRLVYVSGSGVGNFTSIIARLGPVQNPSGGGFK